MRVEAESGAPDAERVAALAAIAAAFPVPTGELAAYRALTAAEQARLHSPAAAPWEARGRGGPRRHRAVSARLCAPASRRGADRRR